LGVLRAEPADADTVINWFRGETPGEDALSTELAGARPGAVPVPARGFSAALKAAFGGRRHGIPGLDPALEIAEEIQDTVAISSPERRGSGVGSAKAPASQMIDIEGQARGLLERLQGPRA
jgi:hypothetical protein